MLEVSGLHAWYGKSHILHGLDFTIRSGEIVALLGRNGSGRSTTAKAIMGLVACQGLLNWQPTGKIAPVNLVGRRPYEIARLGVGYVPEDRQIFPRLSVAQNLSLGRQYAAGSRDGNWGLDDAYALFPQLKKRENVPAGALSGGEQQMLALCRTLMGQPKLMVIDEPTEGLAPLIVQQVADFLLALRKRGVAVLLIEQKLQFALNIADRCLVMEHGRILFQGAPAELPHNLRNEALAVGARNTHHHLPN